MPLGHIFNASMHNIRCLYTAELRLLCACSKFCGKAQFYIHARFWNWLLWPAQTVVSKYTVIIPVEMHLCHLYAALNSKCFCATSTVYIWQHIIISQTAILLILSYSCFLKRQWQLTSCMASYTTLKAGCFSSWYTPRLPWRIDTPSSSAALQLLPYMQWSGL